MRCRKVEGSSLRNVDERKPFNDLSIFEMLLDYLSNVVSSDLSIPNSVRVNEDRNADRTKTYGTAFSKYYLAHRIAPLRLFSLTNSLLLQDALELFLYVGCSDLRARLACTDENMTPYRSFHDRSQLFELLAIFDELSFFHSPSL